MQVVLRSMQGLKCAAEMVPWVRELLRGDGCAQVCGQGQGAFMVQTWAQMRSGNCEDTQHQSNWKSDIKGRHQNEAGGGEHPGADSLMWFAFKNKPLWFLSFLSFLGQSYQFHCRVPHAGFSCCALSTQSYFIYMILTQEQIPHLAAKHMLSVHFPINHYALLMFSPTHNRDRNLRTDWNSFLGAMKKAQESACMSPVSTSNVENK